MARMTHEADRGPLSGRWFRRTSGVSERRQSRTIHPRVATGISIREAFGPTKPEGAEDTFSIRTAYGADKNPLMTLDELELGGLVRVPTAEEDSNKTEAQMQASTLLFNDGRRRIDMIMVYEDEGTETDFKKREKRKVFERNLRKEGLEIELEDKSRSFDRKTFFVKVHVPWKVLTRYAEVMNLKMPIKRHSQERVEIQIPLIEEDIEYINLAALEQPFSTKCNLKYLEKNQPVQKERRFFFSNIFDYDHERIDQEPSFYMASYSRENEDQFIVKDRETFFTSAQRSQIVWQIMTRTKYDENDKIGIRRLINNQTYTASFPLHEGKYDQDAPNGYSFDRRLLYLEWARPSKWYKKQPLWLVRKYFGDKIGLYFAWLGFYTRMLIPASIVGFLCFLYGLSSMDSTDNILSREICNATGPGNLTLCPLCDKACNYQKLVDSCSFAKLTYLFDNPATVFFAIFMSFWATSFLELWKRQQAVMAWEWDLTDVEEDQEPRPEFESSVKTYRINPVTHEKEPYIPSWSKAVRFIATGSVVLFMVFVVMGAVLGTIIYRISLVSVIYDSNDKFVKQYAKLFTSVTAALINLTIIMILNRLYHKIALWLTNLENPRTHTEYEDSFTFKIFFFEFVNFYSSLIYIAFFKGRFYMHPGDRDARSSEFLKLKGDICDPAGCLSELCIQLAIIMVGKQFFNNFLEILYPKIMNWWSMRVHKMRSKDLNRSYTRWEEDYQLQDAGRLGLFEEYLEMVIQYGFVTLFVAAFPLAPLFALLNNIAEIRLDAYKMVTQARRPLAERVENIGAWYGILQGVTYTAVVSNAFVIAYTSDFIPRMVYKFVYSPTDDLVGYIESSLSIFNTSDYDVDMGVEDHEDEPPICRYRGYRNPPNATKPYDLSIQYWHVFAARLAFVVVFEHIVFALTGIMAYAIPDVPSEVKTQIQREKLLAKEAKYEHRMKEDNDTEDGASISTNMHHETETTEVENISQEKQSEDRPSWEVT